MKQGQKQTIKTNKAYFLTLTVVGWADVFTRKNHRDALIDSLKYCQNEKGLIIFAYVIMSNHVHLIANTNEPFLLKDTLRDLKKFTAKKILNQIVEQPESRREWLLALFEINSLDKNGNKNHKFWQEGNHAIELFSEKFMWEKIQYIHNNPVEAGFVKQAHDWVYSSATNYYGIESIIEIETLLPKLVTFK